MMGKTIDIMLSNDRIKVVGRTDYIDGGQRGAHMRCNIMYVYIRGRGWNGLWRFGSDVVSIIKFAVVDEADEAHKQNLIHKNM